MRNNTGTHQYPVAVAMIELDGQNYTMEVAVSECLTEDALLGTDIPLWPHLLKSMQPAERVQLKELLEADHQDEQTEEDETREHLIDTTLANEIQDGEELDDASSRD